MLPRVSLLTRRAAHGDAPQPLAANVQLVLITCGLNRPVKPGRIARSVTLAWDAGAVPVVVLTKADLAEIDSFKLAADIAAAHPGGDVVATSTISDEGIDDLRALVAGRTVVLLGESGAGKSSLTNALVDSDVAAIGHIRSSDAKGRHTTTAREATRYRETGSSSTPRACEPWGSGPTRTRSPPPSPTSTTLPQPAASPTAATRPSPAAPYEQRSRTDA